MANSNTQGFGLIPLGAQLGTDYMGWTGPESYSQGGLATLWPR